MDNYQKLNSFLCLIPAIGLLSFLSIGIIGALHFGELPVYGVHPDPYSLGISWISLITIASACISFITIPISVFLAIDALFNRLIFSKLDLACWIICISSITCFVLVKMQAPAFFSWIVD